MSLTIVLTGRYLSVGRYKTKDCGIAYLVIVEDVRVVTRDALLLGKGLDLLLLRNHNGHQEALQQQQQQ